jgi:hypothetical protein
MDDSRSSGIIRNMAGRPNKEDPAWEDLRDDEVWDPGRGAMERASRRER